jgi:hypothetical protein
MSGRMTWIGAGQLHRLRRAGLSLALWVLCGCITPGVPVESGATVTGASERYRMQVYGDGWKRIADEDLDLKLEHDGGAIVVHVHAKDGTTIDERMDLRKNLMLEGAGRKLVSAQESRELLEGSDLVPVAHARYRFMILGQDLRWMASVFEADDVAVEVIGYSLRGGSALAVDVERSLRSVRIVERATMEATR